MPIGPGTRLGQYVVQDYIGEGAMGVVYRAYHPDLERVGAVKVLQALGPDADSTARFRREAQAIAKLRHPNIVNVFDFGEYEGKPYMIVEYVEGGNLADRLRGGRLDHARAIKYLSGIGEAIDYAHSRGIVHRDIKPANVLLTNNDTPILADFGLVKLMLSASVKSMTGVTTGTPAYMAPEQVSGSQVGPASDRYSLAVVAYQMLAGSIPFSEGGVLEVMYAHVNQAPPPPSTRNPELGPEVDAVLLRGLAKDPKARWESCGAMVAALEAALARPAAAPAERTVVMPPPVPSAGPPGAVVAAPIVPGGVAPPPPDLPDLKYVPGRPGVVVERKAGGARRGWRWFAAAILLLVVATGGVLAYAYATQPPNVSVSPNPARAGSHVVVTARHLPPNQAGTIQGLGEDRSFTAGTIGNVALGFDLPRQVRPGDYVVSVCWDGACHASTILRVNPSLAGLQRQFARNRSAN